MSQREPPFRRLSRTPTLWIVAATVLFFGVLSVMRSPETAEEITLTQFWTFLEEGAISDAEILEGDQIIQGELDDGNTYVVTYPAEFADEIVTQLREAGVPTKSKAQKPNELVGLLIYVLPILLLAGLFLWMMNRAQGGAGRTAHPGGDDDGERVGHSGKPADGSVA